MWSFSCTSYKNHLWDQKQWINEEVPPPATELTPSVMTIPRMRLHHKLIRIRKKRRSKVRSVQSIPAATIDKPQQSDSTTAAKDERQSSKFAVSSSTQFQQILLPIKASSASASASILRASNKVDDTSKRRGRPKGKRMSYQFNSTHRRDGSISESVLSNLSGIEDHHDEQSPHYYQGRSFNDDLDFSAYNHTGILLGALNANHAISESSFRTTNAPSSNTTLSLAQDVSTVNVPASRLAPSREINNETSRTLSVQRGTKGNYGDVINLSKSRRYPFPWKLMKLLDDVEAKNDQHIVSWLQGGRAFKIHDRQTFMDDLAPTYFSQKSFKSFQRQLYLYGFDRISTYGPDKGAFFHPMFLKGQFQLTFEIQRAPQVPKTQAAAAAAAQRKRTKSGPSTGPIEYAASAPSFSSVMQQFQLPQNQSGAYLPPRHQQPLMVPSTTNPAVINPVVPSPTVPSNSDSSLTQMLLSAVIRQLLVTNSAWQEQQELPSAQGDYSSDAIANTSSLLQQVLTNALPHHLQQTQQVSAQGGYISDPHAHTSSLPRQGFTTALPHLQQVEQEHSTTRPSLPYMSHPQMSTGQPQQHSAESSGRIATNPAFKSVDRSQSTPILTRQVKQNQAVTVPAAPIRSQQQQQHHEDAYYGTVGAAPSQTTSSMLPPFSGFSGTTTHVAALPPSPKRPNFSGQDTGTEEANLSLRTNDDSKSPTTQALSTAMIIALLQRRQHGLSTNMDSSSSMTPPSPATNYFSSFNNFPASNSPPAATAQGTPDPQLPHPSSSPSSSPSTSPHPPANSNSGIHHHSSEDWLSDLEKYFPPPSG